jgi:hypothetical protein
MNLRMLRFFLVFSAIGWVICVIGVFISWSSFINLLHGLGGPIVAYDPMLDYWLRMTAGAYALIGFLYLLLALQPAKYRAVIPWFGWVMLVEGLVLLLHGIRLALPPLPFYGDVAASFLGGGGILWFARRAEYPQPTPDAGPHAGGNAAAPRASA